MDSTGKNLKQMRNKCGLSIDEVANLTNIRSHVILALEEDKDIGLPTPYIKSFLKSLNEFYNLYSSSNFSKKTNSTNNNDSNNKTKNLNIEEKIEVIEFNDTYELENYRNNDVKSEIDYSKLSNQVVDEFENESSFETKSESQDKGYNSNKTKGIPPKTHEIKTKRKLTNKTKNIIIYSFIGIFFITVIYLIFFSHSNNPSEVVENNSVENNDSSVLVVKEKENLLSYFSPTDSLELFAKCRDTAWVKVEIDGKSNSELIMLPGMERRWKAIEYIQLSTSKIGNIKFYKNDTLLPNLGAVGSMVKNIKITREGVANIHPLETQKQPIPVNQINEKHQANIQSNQTVNKKNKDSVKTKSQQEVPRKKKKKNEKEDKTIPVFDFSTPKSTKPPILN